MVKKATKNIKEKAVKAALKLAAEKGWENVTLHNIAEEIKAPLHELHEYFEDRFDVLTAYSRMIDRKVLENAGTPTGTPGQETPPRDNLFDVLMERFDILNENREGTIALLRSCRCDPKQAIISLPHLGRSMSWMLDAAGIATTGLSGALKIAGLTGLYLKTLRTWMEDDSPDMAKTMAALDQNLNHAEQFGNTLNIL